MQETYSWFTFGKDLLVLKINFIFKNIVKRSGVKKSYWIKNKKLSMDTSSNVEDPTTFLKIKSILESKEIRVTLAEHTPVLTSEEAAKLRGVSMASGAKAMLLWKKSKDLKDVNPANFVLAVMSASKKLSFKTLRTHLGWKPEMATAEQVKLVTGCLPGTETCYA
jgi:prolyl-tRNA editing enzyme YbaK/EbsC (Cys-tRNA(Pro) deacylase)